MESLKKYLIESSLNSLYDSAVDAFPKTKMRQHATEPITIENTIWIPFVGMKTLFVKSKTKNENREYNSIIVFKNVNYEPNDNIVQLFASDNKIYNLENLSLEDNDVLVRCNCNDFNWRFNYYNHLDKSLYNNKRKKYESNGGPPANPKELPGMCKHLMKTVSTLKEAGLFK